MIKSIQYLQEIGIKKFQKTFEEFYSDPTRFAEFVLNLQVNLNEWGRMMIKEGLEEIDLQIKNSRKRHYDGWLVDNTNSKELITSLGALKFMKTSYYNKTTGEYKYLLDSAVGFEPGKKITEDAMANMYKEAAQTSYRRSGEMMSKDTVVSKATIKNKLHSLKFPPEVKPEKKKRVEYLYIDADEDHVSLQFNSQKGDLIKGTNGRKENGMITKLVYVYEGIEKEGPQSKRHRLINPHYFCGSTMDKKNSDFWSEIMEYIETNYEVDSIKKIYLNADGGNWIKEGKTKIPGITYVVDEFHLNQWLLKMTGHMKDSAWDARVELRKAMRSGTKKDFINICTRLKDLTTNEKEMNAVISGEKFILSNFTACKIRIIKTEGLVGCSAEGHVSHTLSCRMSSLPMGWSRLGATNMAKLRAYYLNDRNFLELARYQKKEIPVAVGAEYYTGSAEAARDRVHTDDMHRYFDRMIVEVPGFVKRQAWMKCHEWLF